MAGKTPELNGSFSGKRICVCSLFDCRVEQRLLNPCCLMIIGEKYGKILSTGYTGFCSIIIGGLTCYNQPLWSPVALFCVWHVCSEPARCQWLPPDGSALEYDAPWDHYVIHGKWGRAEAKPPGCDSQHGRCPKVGFDCQTMSNPSCLEW